MPGEPGAIGNGITGNESDPESSATEAAFQGMTADATYQEEARRATRRPLKFVKQRCSKASHSSPGFTG